MHFKQQLFSSLILVVHYKLERDTSLLMICNKDYIVLFSSHSSRCFRCCLTAIDRSHLKEQNLNWKDHFINSMNFIDKSHIFILAEHQFIIYSMKTFSIVDSWTLPNNTNENWEFYDQQPCIATVHNKKIYYIYLNSEHHWILSIFELETMNCSYEDNLTQKFRDIKRFIYICVNDNEINILVERDGSRYAVIFCLNNKHSIIRSNKIICLYYAVNPLTICSIYNQHLHQYILFINDPSAKIIHILTNEKYLQSYSLIVYAFSYIEEDQELLLTSNDGIRSIDINAHAEYFKRVH